MKRILLVLGSVLAMLGSIGLAIFGSSWVEVFAVLTVRISDPPPLALAELRWAVSSAIVFAIGLVISCVATLFRDGRRAFSATGKVLHTGAGVLLILSAIPLASCIVTVKNSFRVIATSTSSPKAEGIHEMIQSVESTMTLGYAVMFVAAMLLFAGSVMGFRASSLQNDVTKSTVGIVSAWGSVLVGVALVCLIASVGVNGSILEALITEALVSPKPADLAANLARILDRSLLAYVGFGVLGLLQMLASISMRSAGANADAGN